MDIEKLIDEVYKEVLKRIHRNVLLFFTGTPLNIDTILSDLNNLRKYNICYKSVLSDSALDVIGVEKISRLGDILKNKNDITSFIKQSDFVLLATLTRNTLSKLAVGIEDSRVTLGLAEAFMMNKSVIIIKDGADFKNPFRISKGMNKNKEYNKMLNTYFETLKKFGAKLINSNELCDTVENIFEPKYSLENNKSNESSSNSNILRIKSSVITLGDLLSNDKSKEIVIKDNALITPLAKDYIRDNSIKLIMEE